MRKAQGLSVSVIIIAAIALVVMVILIAMVLNSGGDINRNLSACESSGDGVEGIDWKCASSCDNGWIRSPTKNCDPELYSQNSVCCIPLGEKERS